MTDLRKAAEMALETLDDLTFGRVSKFPDARKALRQALAQNEPLEKLVQEATAWLTFDNRTGEYWYTNNFEEPLRRIVPNMEANPSTVTYALFKKRQKSEWVGLTDEEIEEYKWMGQDVIAVIKEVQATLKEKNGG